MTAITKTATNDAWLELTDADLPETGDIFLQNVDGPPVFVVSATDATAPADDQLYPAGVIAFHAGVSFDGQRDQLFRGVANPNRVFIRTLGADAQVTLRYA